jgi:trans-aconitate 2-methyltransferase
MKDWNPGQYLKFENERTRPAVELLRRVALDDARRCVDLGCGPGNSTELVAARFPDAVVEGLDSSPAMIAAARQRLPAAKFDVADLSTWRPEEKYDLIFANAVLQWVPGHEALLPRLVSFLEAGGCLALQMPNNFDEPSHRLMRDVAQEGPWANRLAEAANAREEIRSFETYYGWLAGSGCTVDLWQTTYLHALEGAAAIVEWLKGTGLRPYLDPLPADERAGYLDRYQEEIALAYPTQADGKVLLRFPRLFAVARLT